MTIEAQLTQYFQEIGHNGVTADTQLIESGLIDSMGIQELIAFLEGLYDIEFEMDDLTVENFGSIMDIRNLVLAKKGAS